MNNQTGKCHHNAPSWAIYAFIGGICLLVCIVSLIYGAIKGFDDGSIKENEEPLIVVEGNGMGGLPAQGYGGAAPAQGYGGQPVVPVAPPT